MVDSKKACVAIKKANMDVSRGLSISRWDELCYCPKYFIQRPVGGVAQGSFAMFDKTRQASILDRIIVCNILQCWLGAFSFNYRQCDVQEEKAPTRNHHGQCFHILVPIFYRDGEIFDGWAWHAMRHSVTQSRVSRVSPSVTESVVSNPEFSKQTACDVWKLAEKESWRFSTFEISRAYVEVESYCSE